MPSNLHLEEDSTHELILKMKNRICGMKGWTHLSMDGERKSMKPEFVFHEGETSG